MTPSIPCRTVACGLLAVMTVLPIAGFGAAPRALPEGQVPADARLGELKTLDGYFPFTPPATVEAWSRRAERVRRQILISQGLWPLPTRAPLNVVAHGRIDQGEYTVEKVYFESAPGFFVTGNLYRPKHIEGRVPGVLFAHGHWENARFDDVGEDGVRKEIASGQERFEEGGRSRFQSMCVQLARMGCVVWQWDMLGDSDSQQLSRQLVHGFARQRPEMNRESDWGLFSPQAEAHLQSAMGLQTWNSIRSLDFLLSLPEVDPDRVAVTGASGGGTQSFILAAIDPRVSLSFPAVMVSTAMQGGCTCENACLLRVDTGNVEFAALFAPKPQGLTTANDWTREMASKGFPELKRLYQLLGAADNVMLHRGEHFPHNYNAVSRSAFYTWLNRHFRLGFKEPVIERDYPRLTREQLTVWGEGHPAPPSGPDFERSLLRWFHDDAQRQLETLAGDPAEYPHFLREVFEVILGRDADSAGLVRWIESRRVDRGHYVEFTGLIRNVTYQEELPAVLLESQKPSSGLCVVWLTGQGKAGLFDGAGTLRAEVVNLLEAGADVLGIDLLYQGEFLPPAGSLEETRRIKGNERESAAYTFGYNPAVFAQRVHDVLSTAKFVGGRGDRARDVALVAVDRISPVLAAARAVAGASLGRVALRLGGFRFGGLREMHDPNFLPGGAKYGDIDGMLVAGGHAPLWLGEPAEPVTGRLQAAYTAAGTPEGLTVFRGDDEIARESLVKWLKSPVP